MNRRDFLIQLSATGIPIATATSYFVNDADNSSPCCDFCKWDGLLTDQPVAVDFWDLRPGDIVEAFGDNVFQVGDLPHVNESGVECVSVSFISMGLPER